MLAVFNQYFYLNPDQVHIYRKGNKLKAIELAEKVKSSQYWNVRITFTIGRVDTKKKLIIYDDLAFTTKFKEWI